MRVLFASAAVLVVCAAPALAQADRADGRCGDEPETTGTLRAEQPGVHPMGAGSPRIAETPPEESWQEEARADAERRRRELLACGVD